MYVEMCNVHNVSICEYIIYMILLIGIGLIITVTVT